MGAPPLCHNIRTARPRRQQDQPAASGTVFFRNNTYRAELIDTTLQQFNKEKSMSWRIARTVDFATAVGDQSHRFGVTFLTQ